MYAFSKHFVCISQDLRNVCGLSHHIVAMNTVYAVVLTTAGICTVMYINFSCLQNPRPPTAIHRRARRCLISTATVSLVVSSASSLVIPWHRLRTDAPLINYAMMCLRIRRSFTSLVNFPGCILGVPARSVAGWRGIGFGVLHRRERCAVRRACWVRGTWGRRWCDVVCRDEPLAALARGDKPSGILCVCVCVCVCV